MFLRWALGPIGVLLSLAGTASLMPSFMRSGTAMIVFTSPANRALVVLIRYLGAVLICTLFAGLFVLHTTAAVAWALHCWPGAGLLALGVFCIHLAPFLAISMLLGVWLRRSALALAGSALVWLLCQLANLTYWHVQYFAASTASTHTLVAVAYWLLPKPADMMFLIEQLSGVHSHFSSWPELQWAWDSGKMHVLLSLLTTLLAGGIAATLAGLEAKNAELP